MDYLELQDWIVEKTKQSDLSVQEIADLLGITRQGVHYLLTGRTRDMKLRTFIRLHKVITGQYPIIVEAPNVRHLRRTRS